MDALSLWWRSAWTAASEWCFHTAAEMSEWHVVQFMVHNQILLVSVALLLLLALVAVYFAKSSSPASLKHNIQTKVEGMKDFVGVGSRPRFRKRDKIVFYGRKMLRKVKSVGQYVKSGKDVRKRNLVLKFAKDFLLRKDEQAPLAVLEPPSEYLQEDQQEDGDSSMPSEVLYMLRSVRVFGHFDMPVFLELCKHCETIQLASGQFLFRIGDHDDSVFVVQSGRLEVYATDTDGSTSILKVANTGDSIASLLSFCDVLTGHLQPYKTISARAIVDSIVIRLPFLAFQSLTDKYPETVVRMVQIIMTRLMRMTFTALHHYLGLSSELMAQQPRHRHGSASGSGAASAQQSSPTRRLGAQHRNFDESLDISETVEASESQPKEYGGDLRHSDFSPKVLSPTSETVPASSVETPSTMTRSTSGGFSRRRVLADAGDADMVAEALEKYRSLLQLPDLSLLDGRVLLRRLTPGQVIMTEGSQEAVGLDIVLSGSLHVCQRRPDKPDEEVLMFAAHSGHVLGSLATLSGEASFFTIRTKSHSLVAHLSRSDFYSIMSKVPQVVLHVANTVIRQLSPFVRQIDFALDWVHIEAGRAIYRQSEVSDCMYILLSGRLRSVITHNNGRKEMVAEYTRGDLVGIVETLTSTERSTTVMAIRDTEVAKLSDGLLNFIKLKHPIVVSRLIELLGHRILGAWKRGGSSLSVSGVEQRASQTNFNSVALLAVSDDVPLVSFAFELLHSLLSIGPSTLLTSELIRKTLGPDILEAGNDHKLISWLGQQEDQHRMTLYLCDNEPSPWTQRCIRQSDCILIVALAENGPSVGNMEKQLEHLAVRTQKELVLLHREGADPPRDTVRWLNMRSWCSFHHHVQGNKRLFTKRSLTKIRETYRRVLQTNVNRHSDISRLARLLTGNAVGLVLGGGGARGSAHIGIIKAIQEADIPIDMVGGVSIGALMGALYCREKNLTLVTQRARNWCRCMTQVWRQLFDLTYPVTSWFSGCGFNSLLIEALGEYTQVEDLWLPYFTVTTDITDSSTRVHTHGSLWRYVRGSMTLAGFLPPICDPRDGHLLLDGGYVNNLPADVMHSQMGARSILAVDVGSQDETNLTNYGDTLSGWWLLWNRWYPLGQYLRVLSLADIQSRLAYVSCVRQLDDLKNSDYCEYIRPPIDCYRTLHFNMFDNIREVGYQHGRAYFAGMRKAGTLRMLYDPCGQAGSKEQMAVSTPVAVSNLGRRLSIIDSSAHKFTDLAQMVCRVRRPRHAILDDAEDEADDSDDQSAGVSLRRGSCLTAGDVADGDEAGYHSEPTAGIGGDRYPSRSHYAKGHYSEISDIDVSEDADIGDFSDDLLS